MDMIEETTDLQFIPQSGTLNKNKFKEKSMPSGLSLGMRGECQITVALYLCRHNSKMIARNSSSGKREFSVKDVCA